MSYHQRPTRRATARDFLRSGSAHCRFWRWSYAEACRRAREASNDSLARDWSVVAATIARRGQAGAHPCSTPYSAEQADF